MALARGIALLLVGLVGPVEGVAAAPPAKSALPAAVKNGPGWVPIGENFTSGLAFSANGLWFASFVRGGILLGDSQTGEPLALAPFNYDKATALAFHPQSQAIVALADFSILHLAIETDGESVRLRQAALLPNPQGDTGLVPPAFDHTGRYLAIAGYHQATIYDWRTRRPLYHVNPGLASSWVMGFSRDTLFFVEPTTRPCRCDDYRGGPAGFAHFQLGKRQVNRRWLRVEVETPLHLRQGKLASGRGLWDARARQLRVPYRLAPDTHLVHVFRLRTTPATVGTVIHDETQIVKLVVLGDDGSTRDLGKLPSFPSELAVRPQDDRVMYWDFEKRTSLRFIRLSEGHVDTVPFPEKVCVDDGQVVAKSRCPFTGGDLRLPDLTESPGYVKRLPTYAAPPAPDGEAPEAPREGDFLRNREGYERLKK